MSQKVNGFYFLISLAINSAKTLPKSLKHYQLIFLNFVFKESFIPKEETSVRQLYTHTHLYIFLSAFHRSQVKTALYLHKARVLVVNVCKLLIGFYTGSFLVVSTNSN